MQHQFTLEFWEDDGWFVGKLKEVPGVFSQGETLEELEDNIADAYKLTCEQPEQVDHPPSQSKIIRLDVV
jgi:predicted RNase H-like HicB family nuclease